jgi:hypothetical protein
VSDQPAEDLYELRTTSTVRPGRQVQRAAWYVRDHLRIDDKNRVVTVVDVAHRRDVYRA